MTILAHLKKIDLFRGLGDEALKELSENSRVITLVPRQTLFSEGSEGLYFYVLLSGSIRVFKTAPDGKESTIKFIIPGEFFAETVLTGLTHYPATAAAAVDATVLAIHRESFWAILERREWRDAFIASLFGKLRYLTDRIQYLTSFDVEERFFRFLMDTYGKRETYDIPLPKKDIASAIGTIPETFSRLMQRLGNDGTIKWERNRLMLKKGFWEEYRRDW